MSKPGWKTTEFWLTVVNTVLMALVAFGVLKNDEADQLSNLLTPFVGALIPLIAYIVSRTVVKAKTPG